MRVFLAALIVLPLTACVSGDTSNPARQRGYQAPSFVEEEVETISFSRSRGRVLAKFHFFLRNIGDREGVPSCWMLLWNGKTRTLNLASSAPIPAGTRRQVVGRASVPTRYADDSFLEELEGFCG